MNAYFRADLHCHTSCSDGLLSPASVVRLAAERGLTGLSITDHDTIDAYEEALPVAHECRIKMLSGVEFSTVYQEHSVHVLAYAFPLSSSVIIDLCRRQQQRRQHRAKAFLQRLAENGMIVTHEALGVDDLHVIGRPHIAAALVREGYVKSVKEAFHKFLNEGKKCFVPSEAFPVEEIIDSIHQAGGLAVLAHPMLIKKKRVLRQLLGMNFDGLECYYASFTMDEEQRFLEIAHKKKWLVTGGSDFHDDVSPYSSLGCSWTPEATFRILYDHFLESSK